MRLWFSSALLGLAWFAVCTLCASAAAWLIARALLRRQDVSAGVLLGLRLLPAGVSILFVMAIFLPAHWRYEPLDAAESFGPVLVALAGVAVIVFARAIRRTAAAVCTAWHLRTHVRGRLSRPDVRTYDVPDFPGIALAGVFRTRILIGSGARAALTPAELEMAIAHELAHRHAHDNLKRCAMYCAPDLFGWSGCARQLEARWGAEAECLADRTAAGGDERRAVGLASALLKVARLGPGAGDRLRSPVWSTLHEPRLLEDRVLRLVRAGAAPAPSTLAGRLALALACGGPVAAWLLGVPYEVHRITEALITILS